MTDGFVYMIAKAHVVNCSARNVREMCRELMSKSFPISSGSLVHFHRMQMTLVHPRLQHGGREECTKSAISYTFSRGVSRGTRGPDLIPASHRTYIFPSKTFLPGNEDFHPSDPC